MPSVHAKNDEHEEIGRENERFGQRHVVTGCAIDTVDNYTENAAAGAS